MVGAAGVLGRLIPPHQSKENERRKMARDDDAYLVWSVEHRAWWSRSGSGYAAGLSDAGFYTRARAIEICRDALPQAAHIGTIAEIPVRLADIGEMLKDQMVPAAVHGRGKS
jgi:hypothetical protein